ncbi:MAG: GH3 auxin-responsive promoter family protein [Flavobacteriaceae bacterium]
MKKTAAKWFAAYIHQKNKSWIDRPLEAQAKVLSLLLQQGQKTRFGKDHQFDRIQGYEDFQKEVPIRDYEQLRPYIDPMVAGEKDVLWPGKPLYYAKTSGTTSGAKYIPITKASMPTHITAARDAILNYIYRSGNTHFVTGKQIFLQGSPTLKKHNGVALGRLSGIVAHYVPAYLQKNRMPSWETNCIEDWETKVDRIVEETLPENMTVIAGIPSWVQMYFERLMEKGGKKVGELFPDFSLFIYGGVNFAPYKNLFKTLIGRNVDSIELFPASEGFFAYQDRLNQEGLLLLTDNGIYYEFVEADTFYDAQPKRCNLAGVKVGVNYALILNTTAGLWGYNIGDTVRFVSTAPYRLVVTGRIKHFISAFGEHVIGKEVETALQEALRHAPAVVREFTVAPQIAPKHGLPYHEWFVDFETPPQDQKAFAAHLDRALRDQNIYYDDLITGQVLQPIVLTEVAKEGFQDYMKKVGKLGGQNKVPRLKNDRSIADELPLKK